jgi:transcriptional regulator with XRE-family HTH domain
MTTKMNNQPVGALLREWRTRRRMSQLDLALEAEISTRHLSFLETGRAQPSRDMVLHLAETLDVPLRERNMLLVAAGYAPHFAERTLDDPALAAARKAIDQVLAGHEPYPALAIDRHWTLVAANRVVESLLTGVAATLLESPINVLRLSLHPDGLAPRIANLAEWRAHLLARVRRQIDLTADPVLVDLVEELEAYPVRRERGALRSVERDFAEIAIPFELDAGGVRLRFLSTTMVFGTPVDVTLSELALEFFFPANAATAEALQTSAVGMASG